MTTAAGENRPVPTEPAPTGPAPAEPAPAAPAPGPTAPAGAPERSGQLARQLVAAGAWATVTVLALVAAGRLTHLDDAIGWPYPVLNALTPLLYLPAYAAGAVGFALRRGRLMLAATALIAIHLAWVVPEVWPGHPAAAAAAAPRFRLLTANLRYDNANAGELGGQLAASRPDVVVLEELSPLTYGALLDGGALAGYRYRAVQVEQGAFGVGVFSRFPLSGVDLRWVTGLPSLRVTVGLTGGAPFTLFAVHTLSPTSAAYTRRWRVQLADLRRQVLAVDGPVLLAGDFNATEDHRPLRRLISAGLRDAHDAAGAGWAPTWNATTGPIPPIIRIDHVLVSKAFTVTGYRTGTRDGSDHLPIIVDLAGPERVSGPRTTPSPGPS